jgi:hypothetical protein
MSTSLQQAYMTATALNNMGVSLVERQCLDKASEAFGDAIGIMKEIASLAEGTSTGTAHHCQVQSSQNFDAAIQKSRYHLAQGQLLQAKNISGSDFCVVTEEGCGPVLAAALQSGNILGNSVTFLIRIELEGKSIHELDYNGHHLQSAIILHNFAIMYKCRASTASSPSEAKRHLENSFKLFNLALSVLQNEAPETEGVIPEALPVSIMVLYSLFLLTDMLGRDTTECETYYSMFVDTAEIFLQLETVKNVSVAAAAA